MLASVELLADFCTDHFATEVGCRLFTRRLQHFYCMRAIEQVPVDAKTTKNLQGWLLRPSETFS